MTLSTCRRLRSDPALGFLFFAGLHVQRLALLALAGMLAFSLRVLAEG